MNKMKNQPMHRVWGRIGCLFLLTDLEYKQLTAAMRENNPEAVLEKISEHDKHVIKDFVLWLCDKYEIFEPEKDGYTLYADMKYHDSDEVLKEYFNENK